VRVRELGEFGLIQRIERLAGGTRGAGVVLGIGDDAALLRLRPGEDLVVSTDAAVEGVHFRLDQESPRTAGRRSLAASLSDLAAMGARPLGFTFALAAPDDTQVAAILGMVRGMLDQAIRYSAPLVGGNVTGARELQVTLTVLGAVRRGRALRRDRARAGDEVFVTGVLGQQALERARGRVRHVPQPRLAAGRKLAGLRGIGACIDLSDGLLADLRQLCRASHVGVDLDAGSVPRPRGFAAACQRVGVDPEVLTLGGGEDYELCFTLRSGASPGVPHLARRLAVPVTRVGRISSTRGLRGAPPAALRRPGWRHF